MRQLALFSAVSILVGCGGPTLEGQVVDGITKAPRADLRLVARATKLDAALTCQAFEGTTGGDGRFTIAGLCDGVPYDVTSSDSTVWFPDFGGVPGTGPTGPVTIEAWRLPGDGLHKLAGDKLELIRTGGDVQTTIALQGGQDLRYPSEIPGTVPVVGSDEYLVIAGAEFIAKTQFYPLYKAWDVDVGTPEAPSKLTAWFAGVTFDAASVPTEVGSRVPNAVDVVEKTKDTRQVAYIKGSALEAHRYGAFKDGDRRMFVIDFGGPFQAPEAPAAPPAPSPP